MRGRRARKPRPQAGAFFLFGYGQLRADDPPMMVAVDAIAVGIIVVIIRMGGLMEPEAEGRSTEVMVPEVAMSIVADLTDMAAPHMDAARLGRGGECHGAEQRHERR